eukprot:456470_1
MALYLVSTYIVIVYLIKHAWARTAMYAEDAIETDTYYCSTPKEGYSTCAMMTVMLNPKKCVYCHEAFDCSYLGNFGDASEINCTADLSNPTETRRIPYQMMNQCCSNWCWAAVIATFVEYINQTPLPDAWTAQCALANDLFDRSDCCDKTNMCNDNCNKAFDRANKQYSFINRYLSDGYKANEYVGSIVYDKMLANFNKSLPIAIKIVQPCCPTDHLVAMVGYSESWSHVSTFNSRKRMAKVMDPYQLQTTFAERVFNSMFLTRWEETIYVVEQS